MSTTSSQYYRSANTHSHYPNFPANTPEHLYALTAASWHQDVDHAPYTGPPPATFLHYSQDGADSVGHTSSVPQTWPSGFGRQDIQEWTNAAGDQTYPSRPAIPYDATEAGASVPHPPPEASRHYQPQEVLSSRQELPLSPPSATYRTTDRFHDLRTSSANSTTALDPPFTTHATQPFSRPSHARARTALSHLDSSEQQLSSQAGGSWENGPSVPPSASQQYSDHSNSLAPSNLIPHPTSPSGNSWLAPGETPAGASTFRTRRDSNQHWELAQTQPDRGPYIPDVQHQQFAEATAVSSRKQAARRKVPKVPSSFVERQEKLKVSRRRGPLPAEQREKTHTMRKTKRICVRCRFYKSGCDEGDPCEKCNKITGHARSFREPCYREHLEDTSLVRRCNGREHQEEAEFLVYDWIHNSQLYEMEIMWNLPGYGPIPGAPPMRVTFRPYSPRRGSLDVAASVWTNKDGEVKQVEQPAYAVYDTANLSTSFERYFSSLQPAIEAWIFARISQDEVATRTYTEVLRMRGVHGSKALDLAMRLQCLSVVSQGYGSVLSNNIPGIREYDYRRLGRSDYEAYDRKSYDRPLPGAITHQMDVAAVKYLRKLEKAFVKELAALIFKPKIKPWYELFLAFYVIFWNLEYIHHGANDYIKSKNGTLIENQVNNVVNTQIKKWEFAFPVLLYHWRCTLRGYSPFKLARENPEELREKGHIDHEGFQYVTKMASLFDRTNPALDRFKPPLTGFAMTHFSMSSEYIVDLFKEAGA
ncbi:hypothetical protein DE146DRAFT_719152 [Phaeosphaeria sp. MPI-PUGE-AT-0046c]|nr:hypothetical protein DE146DRAFT_719152 [Phaeosphaeria sp. MPI-PUGE-AT-0046c]